MFRDLDDFLVWVLNKSPNIGVIPLSNAVHYVEDVLSVTWVRLPPYQVQLFIVPPNYIIPEHTHPNVDSFEVYLGGQIRFSIDGKFVITEDEFSNPDEIGVSRMRGHTIRVKPDTLHGGIFGPSGGVFMSVQHWLNGVEPHCVGSDYSGVVMGKRHFDSVVFGKPVLKESLVGVDAAGMEVM